ncbi:MAG TPA: hypothetical protein VGB24_18450 [Longimicrobium sp.]|jgi:hypothetical protein|uniref:hypothetical protein n=1 Tax=Longimicrobium sp. TaxID=2029185 RepID=UPI002EDB44C8
MVSDTKTYPVGQATSVTLEVTYGDADPGSTVTTWQGVVEKVVPGSSKSYSRTPLRGAILFCRSSVKDENPTTNHTCVTYKLSGGPETREYYYELTVPADGAIADYSINFVFV